MMLSVRRAVACSIAAWACLALIGAAGPQQMLPEVEKLGAYVASYGEKASVVVGVEKYTQSVTTAEAGMMRPRQLIAEFAIVKTQSGWVGYRDVVQVNTERVADRQDRLLKLLTEPATDTSEVVRIANESARYNIGPVATNLNLPTTTLFFFQPANLHRFAFTRAGARKIDGTDTVEIAFKEIASPTLVGRRDGTDVPIEGLLWIRPADGAVVRTRLRIRGFLDSMTTTIQSAPAERPAVNPNVATGRPAPPFADPLGQREIRSLANIEVTYALDTATGLWLPATMSEQYEGPIKIGSRPAFEGLSTTRAKYSGYRTFGTGAKMLIPK